MTKRTTKAGARKAPAKPKTARGRGIVYGYRSGLEELVSEQLTQSGVPFEYETYKIPFTPPIKTRHYTPDFTLPNGIVIETKGRFMTADRQKHRHIMAEHPDLDIRFVFSNANTRISKVSKTSYAKWCDDYGFLWATKVIPQEWLDEAPCPKRIAALEAVIIRNKTK